MSKRYNIKWKPDDDVEIRKAVRNFNAKRNRLLKKGIPESMVPERASVTTIRELVATRQDLKRELNSLKRFSRRGAEEIVSIPNTQYNLKTTKWQKEDMEIRTRAINLRRKNRRKELEEIEMKSGGTSLGYTRGEFGMGKADKVSLKKINPFFRTMSQADVNMRHRHFVTESQSDYFNKRDEILRNSFVRELANTYGEDVDEIVDSIMEMPFDEFYRIFQEEPGMFEFAYAPEGSDKDGYISKLESVWVPKKSKKPKRGKK